MAGERIWEVLELDSVSEARFSIRGRRGLDGGSIKIRASNGNDSPAENINATTNGCSSAKSLGYITYTPIMAYKERGRTISSCRTQEST